MSAVVEHLGVAPLLDGVAVVRPSPARNEAAASCDNILGAQPCGGKYFVGAGLLFGRIEADSLEASGRTGAGLRRGGIAPDAMARDPRGRAGAGGGG